MFTSNSIIIRTRREHASRRMRYNICQTWIVKPSQYRCKKHLKETSLNKIMERENSRRGIPTRNSYFLVCLFVLCFVCRKN